MIELNHSSIPRLQDYKQRLPHPQRIEWTSPRTAHLSSLLPLVSIVTIVRNGEAVIEKTLQSVLNQTYPHIEYIIIDGASTDGTLEILKKYQNQIAYIVSEPDQGISDAFNKGIAKASGEWIGLINSGDWYEPNAVERVVNSHQESKPSILYGKMKLWQGNQLQYVALGSHEKLRQNMSINHPAVFIPRAYYEQYGLFLTSLKIAMDYEWLRRAYLGGAKFKYVDEILSNMETLGVSDALWRKGCLECFEIRKMQGMSGILNNAIYYKTLVKTHTRKILEKIGLRSWVKAYRARIWNQKN